MWTLISVLLTCITLGHTYYFTFVDELSPRSATGIFLLLCMWGLATYLAWERALKFELKEY